MSDIRVLGSAATLRFEGVDDLRGLGGERERERESQRVRESESQRVRESESQRVRESESQRGQRVRESESQRVRERERDRETERQTFCLNKIVSFSSSAVCLVQGLCVSGILFKPFQERHNHTARVSLKFYNADNAPAPSRV